MNPLVIKILAVGLTLSQLTNRPVAQFKTNFNPVADQPQAEQLLQEGCKSMLGAFNAEKVDFDALFTMITENMKNAKARADEEAKTASQPTPPTAPSPAPAPDPTAHKMSGASLSEQIDVPSVYAAYRQFCKGEKVENSPIKLDEVLAYYNTVMTDLPDHTKLKDLKLPESTLVLDRDGNRFTEIYVDNNRRKWVSIKDMPEYLPKAFVAAEDKRFFEHNGIDLNGVVRAFMSSMMSKSRPQGGSTITQQVAKNLLTGDDLTFERKMREMVLAARLETLWPKEEAKQKILELYINFVFLGRASWGVEMAAESYFGKTVKTLTVSEAAELAALTRGPNYYHPELHADRLEERRQYVLNRMREDGYIKSDQDLQAAINSKPNLVAFESPRSRSAFYFLDEIQRDAKAQAKIPSLTAGSYVVRSTIHRELQKSVERALENGLAEYEASAGRTGKFQIEGSLAEEIAKYKTTWQEVLPNHHGQMWDIQWPLATVVSKKGGVVTVGLADGRTAQLTGASSRILNSLKVYDLLRVQVNEGKKQLTATVRIRPTVQGAVIVMEAKTGRVLAMTGGFSYALSQYNRATQAARQVGSALKPFIYLSAMNLGFQPNTKIPDMPINLPPIDRGGQWYSPHDFDRGTRGLVTARQAVEQSLNLPTVRIASEMGANPTDGLDYIRGVTQELGIYDKPIRYYPFVLGAQPTRLIDMVTAYATIANIGLKPTPHFIDSIEENGKLVYQRPRFDLQKLSVDRVSFYQIRHILEGTVARGTAQKLKDLTGFVAGKTGTTNGSNDTWFICFTNDLVVGTWVGYDSSHVQSSLGGKFTGARVALPIGEKVIRESFNIYKDKEPLVGPPDEIKSQIVTLPINPYTGQVNGGNYPEIFRTERPGVPKDTVMSLLRGDEVDMPTMQDPSAASDEGPPDVNGDMNDPYPQGMRPQPFFGGPSDAYKPGADDDYDMWNRRNRRIDNFLVNPFFGR